MNKTLRKSQLIALALAAMLVLAGTMPVETASASKGDQWDVNAALYFWYASIGGSTTADSGVDVDAGDLIDNLDSAFMAVVDARKGDWSFMADVVYLSADADEQATVTLPIGTVPTDTSVDLSGWIVTLAGGYIVTETDRVRCDLLAGARYLGLKADLDFTVGAPLPPSTRALSDSGHVWDAIIGVQGWVGLTDKWYLPYYFDVGTGESKSTWQAFAGVGYAFSKVDAVVAYRHIDWELDDSPVFDDLDFDGPFAGIQFRF